MGIRDKIYLKTLKLARLFIKHDKYGMFLNRNKVEQLIEKDLPKEEEHG